MTHAVTAAVASDVDEAVIAVIDGFGEGTSNAFFHYRDGTVKRMQQTGTRRRASLGMFYAMLCHLCGFDPTAGEEWKVMGLAPYGNRDESLWEQLSPLLKVEDLELVKGVSDSEYRNRFEQLQAKIRSSDSSHGCGGAHELPQLRQGLLAGGERQHGKVDAALPVEDAIQAR